MKQHSVVIIGTQPPCSRCKLLTDVFKDTSSKFELNVEVKHIGFQEFAANEFAKSLGLQTGTASSVAKTLNMEIPFIKIAPDSSSEYNMEYDKYTYTRWSYELDEHLRYFENMAKSTGFLMTPAIIINGQLKHAGSVPRMSQIVEWLLEL